jgi:hypothetical protein
VIVHGVFCQLTTTELLDIYQVDSGMVLEDSHNNHLFYMTVAISTVHHASLLLRLLDEHAGIFERIGLVHMWRHPEPESEYAALSAAFLADLDEETRLSLPYVSYADGKHTIRIV